MNTLLLLTSFVLIVFTAANAGYNYPQQTSSPFATVGNGGIHSNQQAFPPISLNVNTPPLTAPTPQLYVQTAPQVAGPATHYVGQVQQQAGYAPNLLHQSLPHRQTIVSKNIYIHSAPEETEEIENDLGGQPLPIRKNYRIVFIKAPSQNIKINTDFIKQSQALNEEKTVIYVLSKKPDVANIQNELVSAQTIQKPSKPEVYFIKYKTQDEAKRAQQEIQAQYEALGGSTQVSDEGVVPVTSVIGGGHANVGSVIPNLGASSVNVPSFPSGSNSLQAASNIQHNFMGDYFKRS